MDGFDTWIANKLLALESDDSVITDYIKGILAGDEAQDEKQEALEGILCGIMETGIEDFCQEIFSKWRQVSSKEGENGASEATAKLNIDDQLSKIMEQHNIAATVIEKPRPTMRDKDVKAAILQQYAEISDAEEEGEEEEDKTDLKNSNRDDVAKEDQERRERLKAESAAKREKDKLDREKQKAQQAERKDKEKKRTAKGEKRR